jgi:electron transfer flavoprotein beta subunit
LAEKLGLTQITYVEALNELNSNTVVARRNIGNGWQEVSTKLPVLLTVTGDANEPRVPAAKRLMKYKKAMSKAEVLMQIKNGESGTDEEQIAKEAEKRCVELKKNGLLIEQWDLDDVQADLQWCGRSGSPTKVHRIQSVVLTAKESKEVEASEKGISDMIHELILDKTIA